MSSLIGIHKSYEVEGASRVLGEQPTQGNKFAHYDDCLEPLFNLSLHVIHTEKYIRRYPAFRILVICLSSLTRSMAALYSNHAGTWYIRHSNVIRLVISCSASIGRPRVGTDPERSVRRFYHHSNDGSNQCINWLLLPSTRYHALFAGVICLVHELYWRS